MAARRVPADSGGGRTALIDGFVQDVPSSRVVFAGTITSVPDEVERLGASRVLLISGGYEQAYADRVVVDLESRIATRITHVIPHVPASTGHATTEQARADAVDLLLCVGGGSATGLAKAVALETGLPILAMASTYAGSEMTPMWGLTKDVRKVTGRDRIVVPKTVIYDPELTVSLLADISAASGMNALAHLAEGLYAPNATPTSALQAAEGVRVLASALPKVVAEPAHLAGGVDALSSLTARSVPRVGRRRTSRPLSLQRYWCRAGPSTGSCG